MELGRYICPDGQIQEMAIWVTVNDPIGMKFCFGLSSDKEPILKADSRRELGFRIIQAGYRIKI